MFGLRASSASRWSPRPVSAEARRLSVAGLPHAAAAQCVGNDERVRFRIVVVGRPRAPLADAIRDYEQRAAHYWPLDVREVKDDWARLADAAAGATLVVCDEHGTAYDSPAFADWLDRRRADAKDVAFMIGGAFGLPAEAKQSADAALSLAPWTLPHELARLVLAEQLYRAGTILRKEPYHK